MWKRTIAMIILVVFWAAPLFARKWEERVQSGNSSIIIKINEDEEGIKIWDVIISIVDKNNNLTSLMKYDQVYFKYSIEKTKSNAKYFVFQAYCSGSGCNDLDNWGIIDNYGQFVLVPYENNRKWKEQIINEK